MRTSDKLFIVTCLIEVVAATEDEAESRATEWCAKSHKTHHVTWASVADTLTDVLCNPDQQSDSEECLICSARSQCKKLSEAHHA